MTDAVRAQISASLGAISTAFDSERQRTLQDLNQNVRRMILARDAASWKQAVLDAARPHAERAVLWHTGDSQPAAAITSAIESKETLVAACTASEFPQEVIGQLGDAPKAFVFPLGDTRAVLIAASSSTPVETPALEMIAQIAGIALSKIQGRAATFVGIAAAPNGPARPREAWAALPREEQQIHLRAQRFARTKAAEMQLYHDHAVKAGRKNGRLYDNLKPQIDAARSDFRDRFLPASKSMVDYLHLELVRTLANEEENLLGLEYPGPLL